MDYFTLLQQIKQNDIPSVLFLYGEENYFIQNVKRELEIQVVEKNKENISTYDLLETPIDEVITDAETFPFFGERKLIFAENPNFVLSRPQKLPFEHHLEYLERYVHSPVDYTVLVFIAPYNKIDKRKKASQLLMKKAVSLKFEHIKERDIHKWIHQFGKIYNLQFDQEAVQFLEANASVDLHLLENEIKKLSLFLGAERFVSKQVAEQMLSQTVDSSALALVDAVISRNYEEALNVFKELSLLNESVIGLLALLAHQFRLILQVKLLKQKGYNEYQMRNQIGGHPYPIKLASQRERNFTTDRLQSIIHRLAETDANIKTGRVEEDIAVELLLYDLITNE